MTTKIKILRYFIKRDYSLIVRLLLKLKISPEDITRLAAFALQKDSLNSLKVLSKLNGSGVPSYEFGLSRAVSDGNFKIYKYLVNKNAEVSIRPSLEGVHLNASNETIHNILKSS